MRSSKRSRAAFRALAGAVALVIAALGACGDPGVEPEEDELEEAPDAAPAAAARTGMEIVEYEIPRADIDVAAQRAQADPERGSGGGPAVKTWATTLSREAI